MANQIEASDCLARRVEQWRTRVIRPARPTPGLVAPRTRAYLGGMSFFSRFSPVRAYKDLRLFLAGRERHELGFLAAAIAITGFFVYAFARNDYDIPPKQPEIIYVQQWRADRTDAQIRAQQAIDKVKKDKEIDAYNARVDKMRAQFKAVDDTMNKWGL